VPKVGILLAYWSRHEPADGHSDGEADRQRDGESNWVDGH